MAVGLVRLLRYQTFRYCRQMILQIPNSRKRRWEHVLWKWRDIVGVTEETFWMVG